MTPDRPSDDAGSQARGRGRQATASGSRPSDRGHRIAGKGAGKGAGKPRPADRRQGGQGQRIAGGKPRPADRAPRGRHAGSRATASGSRVIRHGARAAASLTRGGARHKKAPAGRRGQGQGGGWRMSGGPDLSFGFYAPQFGGGASVERGGKRGLLAGGGAACRGIRGNLKMPRLRLINIHHAAPFSRTSIGASKRWIVSAD